MSLSVVDVRELLDRPVGLPVHLLDLESSEVRRQVHEMINCGFAVIEHAVDHIDDYGLSLPDMLKLFERKYHMRIVLTRL